jgi:hypothetical protein
MCSRVFDFFYRFNVLIKKYKILLTIAWRYKGWQAMWGILIVGTQAVKRSHPSQGYS